MRFGVVLRGVAIALAVAVAIASAGFAWLRYAPRRTPAGQPALFRLDAATLPAFREAFNAARSETRVIALLSPT